MASEQMGINPENIFLEMKNETSHNSLVNTYNLASIEKLVRIFVLEMTMKNSEIVLTNYKWNIDKIRRYRRGKIKYLKSWS